MWTSPNLPQLSGRLHPLAELKQWPECAKQGVVSIGNFDGVHLGHTQLVAALRQCARRLNAPAVCALFFPHPASVLRREASPPPLTTLADRARLLLSLGVDHVVAMSPTPAILGLTPREFFEQGLLQSAQARGLVEGPNFCFGKDRSGDIPLLQQLAAAQGMECFVVEAATCRTGVHSPKTAHASNCGADTGEDGSNPSLISSSRIREHILSGDMNAAARLLGRPYFLEGVVEHGAHRGAKISFPTANLAEVSTLVPAGGVYAGMAETSVGVRPAAIHIGANPTFTETTRKLEAHILDFDDDLYSTRLRIAFIERLRGTVRFNSVDALIRQLRVDVAQTRMLFNEWQKREKNVISSF